MDRDLLDLLDTLAGGPVAPDPQVLALINAVDLGLIVRAGPYVSLTETGAAYLTRLRAMADADAL